MVLTEAEKKKARKARSSASAGDKAATASSNQGSTAKAVKPCHYEARGSGNCRHGECKLSHMIQQSRLHTTRRRTREGETIAVVHDVDD